MIAAACVLAAVLAGTPTNAARETRSDMIGVIRTYVTRAPDTFVDLARRFGLGYVELAIANPGIDPWVPGAGVRLVLPEAHLLPDAPRRGIVINLAEMRLYYFAPGGREVRSYPIGIGFEGWETPLGRTKVVRKRVNPTWTVPRSIRRENPELPAVVPPGPANPLGSHALDLGWPGYLLHGTNRPAGIGRRVSHGCIRLYPEDIADLFERVAVGTPVRVVDQPVKIGWRRGELYLEIHPTQAEVDRFEETGILVPRRIPRLENLIIKVAGKDARRIDWTAVANAARLRNGVPLRITRPRR